MDKYEFNIKVRKLKENVARSDWESALKIADVIEWDRVPSVGLLITVADVYEKCSRYDDAARVIDYALARTPNSKGLIYKFAEMSILAGNIKEADDAFRDYIKIAKNDPRQDVLRYMLLSAENADINQRIKVLERYNRNELSDRWMWELAQLYHEAGMSQACIDACDNITLLFGLGEYVDRAISLKTEGEGQQLNEQQKDILANKEKYEKNLEDIEKHGSLNADFYDDEEDDFVARPERQDERNKRIDADKIRQMYGDETESSDETDETLASDETLESVKAIYDEVPEDEAVETEERLASDETLESIKAIADALDDSVPVEHHTDEDGATAHGSADLFIGDDKEAEDAAETQKIIERAQAERIRQKNMRDRSLDAYDVENNPEQVEDLDLGDIYNEIIIAKTAEEGMEKAIARLKRIHIRLGQKPVAIKIKAKRLNIRKLPSCYERILGKDLIIEEAGELDRRTVADLVRLLEEGDVVKSVILVDNPLQVATLVKTYPILRDYFIIEDEKRIMAELAEINGEIDYDNIKADDIAGMIKIQKPDKSSGEKKSDEQKSDENTSAEKETHESIDEKEQQVQRDQYERDVQIDGSLGYSQKGPLDDLTDEEGGYSEDDPEYCKVELEIEEFAEYARGYADSIDCVISGKSMLALYERIEIMEEENIKLTRKNAEILIEEAADRAEKPPLGLRLKNLFRSKYDKEGRLILKEEDFI